MEKVKDVMIKGVATVTAQSSVTDALKVMRERAIGAVIVTENERPVGIFTEHRSGEDTSRLVQESSIATFVINKDHIITHWNKACENLTGLRSDEMINTTRQWRAFFSEEGPVLADFLVDEFSEEKITEHYGDKSRKSAIVEGAYEVQGFLGESGKWLFFTAAPLKNADGEIVGAIETLHDITERKIAEVIQRVAVTDMEEAYEDLKDSTVELAQTEKITALGDLSAGIAHELKQPINVVKIICQSLLNDIKKNRFDPEELKEDLPEMIKQMDRMSDVIDHMRAFSQNGEDQPEQIIDLNDVVTGAMTFVGQQLKNNSFFTKVELASDMVGVWGKPIRLEQVLLGLITNARNAIDESGKDNKKIWLKTFVSSDKEFAAIEVKDNGKGIPEDRLEAIFEPFVTTKKAGRGTGLGLSVSKDIIGEHGGKIEVESTPGEGSIFRIILPAAPPEK